MKKHWIFNSFGQDFLALWGIAFPLILILMYLPEGRAWESLAIVAYIFIDSGHAYATAFRTYFNKRILLANPLYFWVPLALFAAFFSWAYFGLPYLWSFVLYSTFYHNTRQHFGILKWYEKLNGKWQYSSFFLYGLTVLPFIGFHFKAFHYSGIYHDKEFFFYPQKELFLSIVSLNGLLLLGFLIFAFQRLRKAKISTPVFYAILFPGLVNFCCFNLGTTVDQVLIPMVVIHGIAYFSLTAKVLKVNATQAKALAFYIIPIVVVCAVFGFVEYLTQINFVDSASSVAYRGKFWMSLAVSVVVVPLMTHYVLDALIWKRTDKEFQKLF